MASLPTITVVIITRNRPQMVGDCLEHLHQQTMQADEVVVVDSSTGEDTQAVLNGYPEVTRLRIPNGRDNMPQARNLGIAEAQGEIIAFLDDDSMVRRDWLQALLEPYGDEAVVGVGGRVIDSLEQTRASSDDARIGAIRPNGQITTNFVLDPGRPVEVDHVRGCNMSFRRDALVELGGFDPRYIGTNVAEETDVCLGMRQRGWTLVFQPAAVVDHLAAPREGYDREDWLTAPRSVLSSAHNRSYLFFKHYGINRRTLRHNLGGMQLLYLSRWRANPNRATGLAVLVYGLGAWWALGDGLLARWRARTGSGSKP